jgi:cytochrome c-type biogenesis protein CcmF
VGGLIAGTSVSHVAMNSSLTRDVWTAVEPDIEAPNINRYVTIGNEKIPTLGGARVQALAAALTLEALAKEYRKHPPTAQFNMIVSPLVMWIWIGGIIGACGGLTAMWPAPSAVRRRIGVLGRSRAGVARV